ncbi:hypothetical protein B0O99DRAFT_148260 [Bisporella sp. PMI_857]|nr:hypothetical protein B0O99DRAFT_148260 [Bisporella sp. PMI_857]
MDRLSGMHPQRIIDWNKDCRGNLGIAVNVEAAMAFCVGEVQDPPCKHCAKKHGGFTKCVSVPGFLQGSCASCHYNRETKRCSFYRIANTSPARPYNIDRSVGTPPNNNCPEQREPTATIEISHERPAVKRPEDPNNSPALAVPAAARSAKTAYYTARYQKTLSEVEQMTLEEQQLELADLNFRKMVFDKAIANEQAPSQTSRYQRIFSEAKDMSVEEQQLELADANFRIRVIREAIGISKVN